MVKIRDAPIREWASNNRPITDYRPIGASLVKITGGFRGYAGYAAAYPIDWTEFLQFWSQGVAGSNSCVQRDGLSGTWVTSFISLYPVVIRCLQQCAEELSDAKATASARMLLLAIQQLEFIVSACVLNDVLSVTHNLSQLLQSVQIDLLSVGRDGLRQ